MQKNVVVSQMDKDHYEVIRNSVSNFLRQCSQDFDKEGYLLDIAPQDHEGASFYFKKSKVFTLDINPNSQADFILDICNNNSAEIKDNYFDYVVCTEVLEHTCNPFDAAKEIYRILKPDGFAFITVPFNFRIHGPLPDCWRFTEYGLKELFKAFKYIKINRVETKERDLMPIHYTIILQK
jgi:SAM-dependent methyltransferase